MSQLVQLEHDPREGWVVADAHVDDVRGARWRGEGGQGDRRQADPADSRGT